MGTFTQTTCYVVPWLLLPMAYTPLPVGGQALPRLDESRIGGAVPTGSPDRTPLHIVIILTRRQLFRMTTTDIRVSVWQTFGARYAAYAATPFYCTRFLGKMAGDSGS